MQEKCGITSILAVPEMIKYLQGCTLSFDCVDRLIENVQEFFQRASL